MNTTSLTLPRIERVWAMPSRWTFEVPPIREFVSRWTVGAEIIVDPFAGNSIVATHRNDLAHKGGMDALDFLDSLLNMALEADVVILDPPYSPRQISEVYRSIGRDCGTKDTQNARLYKESKTRLTRLLKFGGTALSFGWNSSGFGPCFEQLEILLVCHGSAHNDTICVAERKVQGQFL